MFKAMEKLYLSYNSYDSTQIRQHVINNFSEGAIVEQLINNYKKFYIKSK